MTIQMQMQVKGLNGAREMLRAIPKRIALHRNGPVRGALKVGAYFLRDKEPADQDVFFFGFPRMGYFSLSTIPFLAPEKQAQDVIEPLTGPAALPLRGPTLFIFLPERLHELEFVRQQVPDGALQEFYNERGELLFVVYESS